MYQKIIIIGNLGSDPEMRYMPDGTPVTSFSVATNRKWGGDNPGEEVTWFRVSAWGRQAETCNQYLSKGRQVMVEGRLTPDRESGGPRLWQDNAGQTRASFELRAFTVQFLSGGNEAGGAGRAQSQPRQTQAQAQQQPDEIITLTEDEIPF